MSNKTQMQTTIIVGDNEANVNASSEEVQELIDNNSSMNENLIKMLLINGRYSNNVIDNVQDEIDHYVGAYDSVQDYAEQLVDDTGMLDGVNEIVARYFDFKSFAKDLVLGGDIWTLEFKGQVHVFTNN